MNHDTDVRRIDTGFANAYLVRSDLGVVLVDSGRRGRLRRIYDALVGTESTWSDIVLIAQTHAHYDHVENTAEAARRSGAPVLVHEAEAELLRRGESGFPAGATRLGRAVRSIAMRVGTEGAAFEPVDPAIVLGVSPDGECSKPDAAGSSSREYDLHHLGFPGIAIHVPSHTAGSLAFLTDDGDCLTGDVLFNILGSLRPPFADAPQLLHAHWRVLLDRGARRFHPGHGSPFERHDLERALARG